MKLFVAIIFLLAFNTAICQSNKNIIDNNNELVNTRVYFSTFTVGAIEFLSFNFGYQVNNSFSVSLKIQNIATAIGLGLTTGWGAGITGAYYFDDELLNSIKLSVVPLYSLSEKTNDNQLIKAISYELTLNHENLVAHSFRFYYEIGAAVCTLKHRDALIGPSLKIGVLYNF